MNVFWPKNSINLKNRLKKEQILYRIMKINELKINESNFSDGRPLISRNIISDNDKNVKSILDIKKFFCLKYLITNQKQKT